MQGHDEFKIPTRKECFSKWKKGELLGKGEFGEVYQVTLQSDDLEFVLKTIDLRPTAYASKDSGMYRGDPKSAFVREVMISKKAGELGVGPRIQDYYYCGPKKALRGIIVMDKIDHTYRSYIAKQTAAEKKRVALALAEKLLRLHDANIVHRDVHDRQILISSSGEPFFIDYGLSHIWRNGKLPFIMRALDISSFDYYMPKYIKQHSTKVFNERMREVQKDMGIKTIKKMPLGDMGILVDEMIGEDELK